MLAAGTKLNEVWLGAAICPPNNELHYFGFIDEWTKFDDEQTNNLEFGQIFLIRQAGAPLVTCLSVAIYLGACSVWFSVQRSRGKYLGGGTL